MASQTETARAEVILNGQKANATLKELENAARALNAELRKMPTNTGEFTKKSEEYQKVKSRLGEVKAEINGTQGAMSRMADAANKYFQLFTMIGVAVAGAVMAIKGLIETSAELSDSLADIQKVTGMTVEEVNKLNKELKKIDTRTSREDLRKMAAVAGQLGIASKDIVGFVDAMDKLNVSIGGEISGGAEQVAKEVGTLRNVLVDFKTGNVTEDILLLGNAISKLALAGFATAPVVIDFASRIGGIGIPLGLTTGQVLGLSATLQELAIKTEKGGTAIGRILQKMTINTGEFAKVANMDLKSFTALVNNDLFAAFTKVVEGSKRSGTSATLLATLIHDLEISGMGASEVFAKLGNNLPMLAEKVALMGPALQTSSGLMDIFKNKNENLAATIAKLGKEWHSMISAPAVTSFFTSLVAQVVSLVNWLKVLPETIQKYSIALIAATGVMGIWIAAKTRSLQVSLWNTLAMKEGILLKIKDAVVIQALIVKEQLWTIWKGNGTVATKLATTAQWAWNAAITANPIASIIVLITAMVAAIKAYDQYNERAVTLDKLKASATILLANANEKLKKSYELVETQVRGLNKLSAAEKTALQDKLDLTIKLAEAELLLMEAKQKAIGKAADKPTLWQGIKVMASGPDKQIQKLDWYADKNSKEATEPLNEGIASLRASLLSLKQVQTTITDITKAETIADEIHGKSLSNLEEKLSKYQVALRNTVAGSEDYVRIQNKIKETNKEIAKFNVAPTADSATTKKKITEYEKLKNSLDDYIKALQDQIKLEYEVSGPVNNSKVKAIADQIASLTKEKNAIDAIMKSEIERAGYDHSAPISPMQPLGVTGKQPVLDPKKNPKLRDKDEVQQDPLAPGWTMKGFDDKDKKAPETDIQVWAKKANDVVDYAGAVVNQLSTIDMVMSSMENAQLSRDQAINDKKKDNLKNQLDRKLITQKQYDAQVAKLDLEMDAKKRKLIHDQAVRAKALAVVNAVINVAQGITSALTMAPPASFVMAALTGVLGAIQIGMILGQEVPQAKKGRYNVIGMEDGKKYDNTPLVKRSTGILDTPSLLVAEAGPELIVDSPTLKNIQINYPWVMDAINYARVPQYFSGNYPKAEPSKTFSTSTITTHAPNADRELIDAINELTKLSKTGIKAFIIYDDLDRSHAKVDQIQSDVTNN